MLRSYAPALVFLALGGIIGVVFAMLNTWFGPKREVRRNPDPYECGLPSEVRTGFRFGISFYLVAMMFILFDIEILFLFPVAIQLREYGMHGLIAFSVFLTPLMVCLFYEWRRGALDWR